MKQIKPVYVMNQPGVTKLEKRAVLEGIETVLEIGNAKSDVVDVGVWREPDYKNSKGQLKREKSVDWYLLKGKKESKKEGQLNGGAMLSYLGWEEWRKKQPHFDVFIVNSDMYSTFWNPDTGKAEDANFIIGIASSGVGTVLSTNRRKGLPKKTKYECIVTETEHEFLHAFGLVNSERVENAEYSMGPHCAGEKGPCIMRQGLTVPDDWITMSQERLDSGKVICEDCVVDLESYIEKYF